MTIVTHPLIKSRQLTTQEYAACLRKNHLRKRHTFFVSVRLEKPQNGQFPQDP